MSIVDLKAFFQAVHPFDTLSEEELATVLEATDIAYYPKETPLCTQTPDRLHLIIKGGVEATDAKGNKEYFGEQEILCASEILGQNTGFAYRVVEDLLCYELSADIFKKLLENNGAFKTFFLEDAAARIRQMRELARQGEMTEFLTARIRDIYLHSPCFVSCDIPVREAVERMESAKSSAILVENGGAVGIVTDTDLRRRVILAGRGLDSPIGDIATWELLAIDRDDFLFNALLVMTRHGIKRLAVRQNGRICGLIEQIDLLSYFSNHSYLLSVQIDKAVTIEDLKAVTEGFVNIVRSLHHKGVKARYIARIVSELNTKIFQKIFTLVFPESWHADMALMVMGSEGREEQILRTDQDNALVMADGFTPEGIEERAKAFNDALRTLGFPDCPGGVMVENPAWRKSVSDFKADIDAWIDRPEGEATLSLAILVDARCVAGEAALTKAIRNHIFERMAGHPTALGLFAQAVERFEIPLGWFGRLGSESIDLKKGGLFILMHGIRALALEHRIEERPTVERIKHLSDIQLIDRSFATELIESYDVLLSTLLSRKLVALARGETPDNRIALTGMSKLERDMLRDALKTVKRLKEFVAYHFKLNMVG